MGRQAVGRATQTLWTCKAELFNTSGSAFYKWSQLFEHAVRFDLSRGCWTFFKKSFLCFLLFLWNFLHLSWMKWMCKHPIEKWLRSKLIRKAESGKTACLFLTSQSSRDSGWFGHSMLALLTPGLFFLLKKKKNSSVQITNSREVVSVEGGCSIAGITKLNFLLLISLTDQLFIFKGGTVKS